MGYGIFVETEFPMARLYKPLPGHDYHLKSDDELRYIIKDAGEASVAMKDVDTVAEIKYMDQALDALSFLKYRLDKASK